MHSTLDFSLRQIEHRIVLSWLVSPVNSSGGKFAYNCGGNFSKEEMWQKSCCALDHLRPCLVPEIF
jgi:hypothetical protein